jgi:hypothetical protein
MTIADELVLVPTSHLSGYERVDETRVAEIAQSLFDGSVLDNPLTCDVKRGLIIDGHHRAEALTWLGVSLLPCFDVDYTSPEVTISSWDHLTDASVALIRREFAAFGADHGSGPWNVMASVNDEPIAISHQADPILAAEILERICMGLAWSGHPTGLAIPSINRKDTTRPGLDRTTRINMSPPLGKEQVLEAWRHHVRLPPQVNRHLIQGRPVGLGIPLTALRSESAFVAEFGELARLMSHGVVAGATVKGRYYEESIRFFGGQLT